MHSFKTTNFSCLPLRGKRGRSTILVVIKSVVVLSLSHNWPYVFCVRARACLPVVAPVVIVALKSCLSDREGYVRQMDVLHAGRGYHVQYCLATI